MTTYKITKTKTDYGTVTVTRWFSQKEFTEVQELFSQCAYELGYPSYNKTWYRAKSDRNESRAFGIHRKITLEVDSEFNIKNKETIKESAEFRDNPLAYIESFFK